MTIEQAYNDVSTIIYKKLPITELRKIAIINKKHKGIFEKYHEYEINMLTKRQLVYILETEQKYKQLRREL